MTQKKYQEVTQEETIERIIFLFRRNWTNYQLWELLMTNQKLIIIRPNMKGIELINEAISQVLLERSYNG